MVSRLSPKARRNLIRILPFGVIWLLLAQVFLISDWAATGSFSDVPDTAIELDPGIYVFATLAVAAVGLLVGAVELLYLNRRFVAHSLTVKLVGKTLFYVVLLTVVILVTFPIAAAMEMDASLFYAEISEHMGAQVLTDFLTGRYHTPTDEHRVFLFSDMKSSTRFAEELGHARYFEFLQAYYESLSDAIVDHGGEVYQYIGDEIVLSWPEDVGLTHNRCIRCVVRMQDDLNARASWFDERFGRVPEFKAGLQLGAVTTGEIGALKKEIVFTGDVLNQTARIQATCGELGVDVLVGDELRSRLTDTDTWSFRSVGTRVLRGREQPVELFALEAPRGGRSMAV